MLLSKRNIYIKKFMFTDELNGGQVYIYRGDFEYSEDGAMELKLFRGVFISNFGFYSTA